MTELDRLRRDCAIAGKTWNRSFSALLLSTLRSHGGAVLDRLWAALLLSHQDMYFVSSLQKLGIASDPPAVAAAKYHYFSNSLGGLGMEYVEENSRKVWIRYLAPACTYPGTALAALPLGVRRTVFSTWHPRNGELMGCRRLGWGLYAELLRCSGHEVVWHEPRTKVRQLRLVGLKPFPAPC